MENRGGKRAGAGRKPAAKSVNDKFRKRLESEARQKAKETGKTVQRVALDLAYDPEVQDAVRVGALKLIGEWSTVKESHSTKDVNVNHTAPVILPVMEDDPAHIDDNADPVDPLEDVH